MADDSKLEIGVDANTDPAARKLDKLLDDGKEDVRELGRAFDDAAEKKAKLGGEVPLKTTEGQSELKKLEAAASKAAEQAARLVSEAKKTGSAEGWDKASNSIEALRKRIAAVAGAGGDASRLEQQLASLEAQASGLGRQFAATETAFGKLAAASEANSPRLGKALAPARAQLDELRKAIDRARATGGPVPPEWLARLDKFEAELTDATAKTGRFRKAQQDVSDDLRKATISAGEAGGQINSLTDAIILKFPKAEQAIIGGVLALATFEQSFRKTREVIEGLKKHFGIDVDAATQESIAFYVSLYEKLAEKLEDTRAAEQRVENMTKILDAQGIKHGKTVKEIEEAYGKLDVTLRRTFEAQQRVKESQAAFVSAAAGLDIDHLRAKIVSLFDVFRQFNDVDALAASPLFDRFVSELAVVSEALDKFGAEFRKSLTGKDLDEFDTLTERFQRAIRDRLVGGLVEARVALREFGVKTPEEVRKAADSLVTFVDALGGIGKVTAEQAKKIHDEALRLIQAIAQQPKAQRDAASALVKELDRIVLAYGKAADSAETFAEDSYAAQKAAAEKLAALLKQHREELAGFAKGVTATWDELLKKTREPLTPDEMPERRAAQEELAGLKAKPTKSLEEIEREAELEKQLRQTTSATQDQGQANQRVAVSADELSAAVSRLREELRAGGVDFANLSQLQREEIEVLFSRLQQSASETGSVAVQEVDGAFGRIKNILAEANLQAVLTGKGLADVGVQAQSLGTAAGAAAPNIAAAGQAVATAGEAAAASGGGYIKATRAVEDLEEGMIQLKERSAEIGPATDEATAGVIKFRGETIAVKKDAEDAEDGFIRMGDQLVRIGEQAEQAAPPLDQVGTAAEKAGEGLTRAAEAIKPISSHSTEAVTSLKAVGEAAKGAGEQASEGATGIDKLAAASGKAAPQVATLQKEAAAVAKLKLGPEFEAIGKGVDKAAERLPAVVKGLSAFLELAKGAGPAGEQLEALFRSAAEGLDALDDKLSAVVAKLKTAKELAVELDKALAAASIDKAA